MCLYGTTSCYAENINEKWIQFKIINNYNSNVILTKRRKAKRPPATIT